jgi:hypothetical protein
VVNTIATLAAVGPCAGNFFITVPFTARSGPPSAQCSGTYVSGGGLYTATSFINGGDNRILQIKYDSTFAPVGNDTFTALCIYEAASMPTLDSLSALARAPAQKAAIAALLMKLRNQQGGGDAFRPPT